MIPFIKKNWISILLVSIVVYLLIYSQNKEEEYKDEINEQNHDIEVLESSITKNMVTIDSLENIDVVFVDRIIKIKTEADEKIKFVDTMSVSDMQSFYSVRYPTSK